MFKLCCMVLLIMSLNGCGFLNVSCKTGIPYSGTIADTVEIVRPTLSLGEWLLIKPVFVMDLPFTVILDTLFLPFFIL